MRDITLAEARVYDSDNTPLSEALKGTTDPKPYITVYTDEDVRMNFNGRDVYLAGRETALVIEIAVAGLTKLEGGEISADATIPASDAGFELAVDIVEAQALKALFGDPRNEWAQLLNASILRILRMPSTRGASGTQGARWAARQVIIRLDPVADPPAGVVVAADHPLRRFIALARADANAKLGGAANLVEMVVGQARDYSSWEEAQGWLGIGRDGVEAIGLAPLVLTLPTDLNEGPELEEATPEGKPIQTFMPDGTEVPDYWPKPGLDN